MNYSSLEFIVEYKIYKKTMISFSDSQTVGTGPYCILKWSP